MTRRQVALDRRALLAAGLALPFGPALAQEARDGFPSRPITLIDPYSAGGMGDTLPRVLVGFYGARLGQQVLVENRPGASQIIGAQAVMRAEPDGYTLLWASTTSMAINTIAQKKLPYDPVKDFAPVGVCFTAPLYLVVNPKSPVKSVKELIAYAKANPGKLSFGSGGNGSTNHLAGVMFMQQAGIEMLHVPYKGAGPAIVDLMGGQLDLMFEGGGLEYARKGQLRVLAVASAKRSHTAPDLPTVSEAGVPGFEASVWFGVAAPAGTPAAVMGKLSRELLKTLADPQLAAKLPEIDITPSTPQQMAELVRSDIAKWREVVASGRITFE